MKPPATLAAVAKSLAARGKGIADRGLGGAVDASTPEPFASLI